MQNSPVKGNRKSKNNHQGDGIGRIIKRAGQDVKQHTFKEKNQAPAPVIVQSNSVNDAHDNCDFMIQKLSKLEWDALKIDEAYAFFRDIEKTMKNILKFDPKQALLVISDLSTLKTHMIKALETIACKDIQYFNSKELDKRLWILLKTPLDPSVTNKGKTTLNDADQIKIINNCMELIQGFLGLISKRYPFEESPVKADSYDRKIISNFVSYLGDLMQFKGKLSNTVKEVHQSVITSYFRALSVYPFEGKYYMLLANCSRQSEDLLGAIYWGVRAYGAHNPQPIKENIQKFLEDARSACLKLKEKTAYAEIKEKDLFRHFAFSYLRFYNIIFTKIGVDELYGVSTDMFDLLQKYISHLQKDKDANKNIQSHLMMQIMLLSVFSLHHCVEGYNPRFESYEEVKPRKTFVQIDNDVLAKDTVKYTYGLIYHMLDLVMSDLCEPYLELIAPFLVYLREFNNISDYMLNLYKQLKEKFIQLHSEVLKKETALLEESKNEDLDEEIEKLVEESCPLMDKTLLGFAPFREFYEKIKEKKLINVTKEKSLLVRLRSIRYNLEAMQCASVIVTNPDAAKKETVNLFDMNSIDSALVNQMANFTTMANDVKENRNRDKNPIILDGQNVAIRYGDTRFAAEGLQIVLDFWIKRGHQAYVMLPDYCFNKEEVARRKAIAESSGDSLKHIPDDVDLLLQLKAKGLAVGVPNWNYDDSYIIEFAKNKGAYIITNDRYNDHIEKYSKNDMNKKHKLRNWIRDNCISFIFVGKDFMPNPDFMNEHMK